MSEMVTGGINFENTVPIGDHMVVTSRANADAFARYLSTQWIPVAERLPEEPCDFVPDFGELPEYLVTIEDASVATTCSYCGNGEWWSEGNFYNVVAWMPLPEAYREVK